MPSIRVGPQVACNHRHGALCFLTCLMPPAQQPRLELHQPFASFAVHGHRISRRVISSWCGLPQQLSAKLDGAGGICPPLLSVSGTSLSWQGCKLCDENPAEAFGSLAILPMIQCLWPRLRLLEKPDVKLDETRNNATLRHCPVLVLSIVACTA